MMMSSEFRLCLAPVVGDGKIYSTAARVNAGAPNPGWAGGPDAELFVARRVGVDG
jgi:hypothetical protein